LNTSNGENANLRRGETSNYMPLASTSSAVRAVCSVRCFVTPPALRYNCACRTKTQINQQPRKSLVNANLDLLKFCFCTKKYMQFLLYGTQCTTCPYGAGHQGLLLTVLYKSCPVYKLEVIYLSRTSQKNKFNS